MTGRPLHAEEPPRHADGARYARLRQLVAAIGAIAIVAFAASSAYDAWRAHQESIRDTHRELGNLAKALAEQCARSAQTMDVLLRETAQWYVENGATLTPTQVNVSLAERASGVPQVRVLTIADAQGVQRYRSRLSVTRPLDVSDRSYFIAQRDGSANGLFVSEPLVTRSEMHPTFVLSRRMQDRNGRFAGVVTAIVDLEDMRQFYRAIHPGAGSAISLIRSDGTLILREPGSPDVAGLRFPELAAAREPGAVWVSRIDGTPRFVAVARLGALPLAVVVTREKAVTLAPWHAMVVHVIVRTLLVASLGVLTLAALLRQLRRIEAADRALRVSEERYALAMDAANEGHWDWQIDQGTLFLSGKMRALHGRTDGDAVTTMDEWLATLDIHPDDRRGLMPAVEDHLQGRTPQYDFEYRVRHPDGTWRWLQARGRCMRDVGGKPCRLIGSAVDVTARKEAQAEKERLEQQLRQSQKMEALGTLAGGIAHDFNNILGAIIGYAELAYKHGGDTPARRYLDNVMQAAGRAKTMVAGILGFSRSGFGDRALVNVQRVVAETLELMKASLPENIELSTKLDSGTAAVNCDATQLHQVAMNLCTNAVHAMPAGGALYAALERSDAMQPVQLSHGLLPAGRYVRFTVRDTGGGIPPEVLPRIFDPFFTTKGVGQGTGLGLSLVHGIVADFGGGIDIATALGEGTVFSIWLPMAGESTHPVAELGDDVPRGNGQSVMVVDDERPLVDLAEEALADLGYEPVGFDSGDAALAAFRAAPERFDVVITDEMMPGLYGTQLADEMRRIRPGIRVLLMTGHADGKLMARAAAAGVVQVLRKPLAGRDIAVSLSAALAPASR